MVTNIKATENLYKPFSLVHIKLYISFSALLRQLYSIPTSLNVVCLVLKTNKRFAHYKSCTCTMLVDKTWVKCKQHLLEQPNTREGFHDKII